MEDKVQEPLKPLEQLCQENSLQKYFVGSIADIHINVESIRLKETVPIRVQQLFETAKNLSVYAWFVYYFHTVAELIGFIALEAALLDRAQTENPARDLTRSPGISKLLKEAIQKKWLTEESMPDRALIARMRVQQRKIIESIRTQSESSTIPEPTVDEIAEEESTMQLLPQIINSAPALRNDLAHGKFWLHNNSATTLRTTSRIINQLFTES